MQSPLSALNSDDVCAVMEPFCKQLTADKYRHKHVIDIKCTVINVGINWECHMLLNSCWAGVGLESNWLHSMPLVPITQVGYFTSVLGSVLYTWTPLQLQRCQFWFLFFCACLAEFLYLIQCFITDQCFITVLSWQLNNCLTTFFC